MPPKRNIVAGKVKPVDLTTASFSEVKNAEGLSSSSLTLDQSFRQELAWCLDKLELVLQSKTPDQRQGVEARKAWKTISNPTAPLVKKRQVMRSMFGDYRAKMREEETKFSIKPSDMGIEQVDSVPKSKYFKPSISAPAAAVNNTARLFEFKFEISERSGESEAEPSTAEPSTAELSTAGDVLSDNNSTGINTIQNYYKMSTQSNSSFTFNFNVDDDT